MNAYKQRLAAAKAGVVRAELVAKSANENLESSCGEVMAAKAELKQMEEDLGVIEIDDVISTVDATGRAASFLRMRRNNRSARV